MVINMLIQETSCARRRRLPAPISPLLILILTLKRVDDTCMLMLMVLDHALPLFFLLLGPLKRGFLLVDIISNALLWLDIFRDSDVEKGEFVA